MKMLDARPVLAALLFLVSPVALHARPGEAPPSSRPALQLLRYDEDWSVLRDPSLRKDPFDFLKYVEWGGHDRYVSLGFESRDRYERYTNPGFGAEPPGRGGYLLQRYLAHADVHAGTHFRIFGQIQSALEDGRNGGPRPPDRDRVDLHQAFADVTLDAGPAAQAVLRVGRQEVELGTARLLSVRDNLNTRIAFDAARLIVTRGDWQTSGYVLRPVTNLPGAFDDEEDPARRLWGGYVARRSRGPGISLVAYYLGLTNKGARYDRGTADERRHTIGARVWGRHGALDWNYEAALQRGAFGADDVRAWDVATDTGVSLARARWKPRLGLRADVTSGDRGRPGAPLGTFTPVFTGTAYSGLVGLIGPLNAIDLSPSVRLTLTRRLTANAGAVAFWRYSTTDGIYGIFSNLMRTGRQSRAREIGQQATAQLFWSATAHVSVSGTYSFFRAGAFLRETPPGKDVHYVTSWVDFRF